MVSQSKVRKKIFLLTPQKYFAFKYTFLLYVAKKEFVVSKWGSGKFVATAIKRSDIHIGRKTRARNCIRLNRSNKAKITQRQFWATSIFILQSRPPLVIHLALTYGQKFTKLKKKKRNLQVLKKRRFFFRVLIIIIIIIIIVIIIMKRDFLKHKTVKTNDKIRCFGVFITPIFSKILKKKQNLKRFWREELT